MADSKVQDPIAPAEAAPRYPSDGHEGQEGWSSDSSMKTIIQNAKAATEKEHSMSLLQGIKLYPKAVAWSVLISTCIAMEGYDISLVNNFYAFDQFNRKYGEQLADGKYQVPARVSPKVVCI
jgi:SP family general alpha glucoside:H+ symporter-like MFS transporter